MQWAARMFGCLHGFSPCKFLKMPKNEFFSFSVFIGGEKLEENIKDSLNYVEVDILGPHCRTETTEEEVDGEDELQSSPVLPYEIGINIFPSTELYPVFVFVFVDGYSVCRMFMKCDGNRTVRGFRDGGELKEFLFSLPRLGHSPKITSEIDGNDQNREVGVIEVIIKEAIYKKTVVDYGDHRAKQRKLEFSQATKKDSNVITKGRYLMATTKAGDSLEQKNFQRKRRFNTKAIHSTGEEITRLKLNYRIKSNIVKTGSVTIEDDEDDEDLAVNDMETAVEEDYDEDAPIMTAVIINVEDDNKDKKLPVPKRRVLRRRVITIDHENEKKVPLRGILQNGIINIEDSDSDVGYDKKVPLRVKRMPSISTVIIDDSENEKNVSPRCLQEHIITIKENVADGAECSESGFQTEVGGNANIKEPCAQILPMKTIDQEDYENKLSLQRVMGNFKRKS